MEANIVSKSDYRGKLFEESDDYEDKLSAAVILEESLSPADKSVNMVEILKYKSLEDPNNGHDRRYIDCCNKTRVESTHSLQRGVYQWASYTHHALVKECYSNLTSEIVLIHFINDRRYSDCSNKKRVFIVQQHQKTSVCQWGSYRHHAIITECCLTSNDQAAVFTDVIKDITNKEINIIKDNSILNLTCNTICVHEYCNSNSPYDIFQTMDSRVRKCVECNFVKQYVLVINNYEQFATWCLVEKVDKFQDRSLVPNLKNKLPNIAREVCQASISLPKKDSTLRESVNWNLTKSCGNERRYIELPIGNHTRVMFERLDKYWTQSFPNEDWTESNLWELQIDVNGKINTNLVDDEYYFDSERKMNCKVNETKLVLKLLQRLLNELESMRDSVANIIPHGEITLKSREWADLDVEDQDTDILYFCSPQQDFGQALSPMSFKQEESSSVLVMWMDDLAMIKLLQDNSPQLKGGGRNLPLTMWYISVFDTTHQMFPIRLVRNMISDEQVKDHVADTCYCNSGDVMNCIFNAMLLEGVDCRSEDEECKNTDEIYLRSHAKEIQSRQILQSSFNVTIAFPSQSIERFVYLMYPYMENGDNPGNINLENSAKNMYLKGQEFDLQTNTRIWTGCDFLIACAVHYLDNSSFRTPVFHQAATFNSVFFAENFGMIIGDFGIAVEAIQDTNVANWTTTQGTHDFYYLCNMNLHTYDVSNILFVGGYSDTACYLQTIKGQEWLRRAIDGTENTLRLLTLAPKCCNQSVSLTWLDYSVCMEDRAWLGFSVCMEDRADEIKEDLHYMFAMCTARLYSNEKKFENIKSPACNDEMDSFIEEDVAFITATVMKMPVSSSLPTGDTAVQKYRSAFDLSGSISWDSIVSLRTPDKHSQKCKRQNTVHEIQMVDCLHKSLKDFLERNFTTFDQIEDGDETEQQIQFGIMQHEQSTTEFNEQNVRDISLKNRKKSDFHSTIWHTLNPLPLPSLSRDVIVQFFEGQTTNELREILTQLASDKIPETQTMMKFEMLRLCTMKFFPKDNRPFAIRIIEAGFYYGGCNDQVVCYCCGSRKDNWVLEDIPLLIHQKLAPKCSFLINNAVVNIPIRKSNSPESTTVMRLLAIHRTDGSIPSDPTQGVSSLMLPSSEQNHMKISNEACEMLVTYESSSPIHLASSEGQNVMDNQHTSNVNINSVREPQPNVKEPQPKYPHYTVKSMRINSFHGWPADLRQRPEEMAECGFYFAGFNDCVRCFHCGVGLRHWMSEDDPWVEHARWSTSCVYVYKMKGEEFVSLVKMAVEIAEREEAKQNNSRSNQPPTNNTETSTADTVKKDSQNNKANDSAVPRESTSSTGTTCDAAGSAAASTAHSGNADIQKYLLTDAAQSVLEMGYQPKLIQRAIEKILMKKGTDEMTGQIILEAVFEIEEEGSANSKTETSSQSAQQKERNEKVFGGAEGDSGHIDPEKIMREHRELREVTLCKICLDNTSSVVFLPCGHLVTCPECAPAMRKCPICRTFIKGTVKIFFG